MDYRRSKTITFVINDRAYWGGGKITNQLLKDLWEYDGNIWKRKDDPEITNELTGEFSMTLGNQVLVYNGSHLLLYFPD